MAYLKVQSKNVTKGAGSSYTASYASTPTVNNLLVIAVSSSGPNAPVTSITDNQSGNTYTQVGSTSADAGGNNIQIFYCIVVGASGTFTLTINFAGVAVGSTAAIFEYSGNATSGVLDQTDIGTGTSTTPASTSITPSVANCLVFSAMDDAASDGTTIDPGTNFTIQEKQLTSSTLERIGTEDWIQTTATATTGPFIIGSSVGWCTKVASFKPLVTATVLPRKALIGVGR